MSDYDFASIKHEIKVWYERNYNNIDDIRIIKDTDEILIIDIDFVNCMAQLTVSASKYNPYQFIYFEAVDIETGKLIYTFYDNEEMLKVDVKSALYDAYKFCENF